MIIKSSQRAGHAELAAHLVKAKDIDGTPQTVTVSGSRDLVSNDNVHTALRDMEILAMASQRCRKDLYHISMNPDQVMTDEDWQLAWDAYEKEFGLSHLPYIEVTHDKGEHRQPHKHRVYERVDIDTGKAVQLSHTRIRNEKVARTVEFELGHKLTVGKHNRTVIRQFTDDGREDIIAWMQAGHAHDCSRPAANQNHADVQMEKRTSLPMQQVQADLQECYAASSDGERFRAAIAEKGYLLAKGDKRDYVIVDWIGGLHSPRRRLGIKAKELKERWADLDRQQLDSVDETLRLLKAQWTAAASAATTGVEEDSVTAADASSGRRVANDDRKPLSQLKEDASAIEKEITELQEQLNEHNAETANQWQRHMREPESESGKPRRSVNETGPAPRRGRFSNTKDRQAVALSESDIVLLQGQSAITEQQRRLAFLNEACQTSGKALQSQHLATGRLNKSGEGEFSERTDADGINDYRQLWQQRMGRRQSEAMMARSTGAQYRLADRFILQRLAQRGYSRQQARRVLMQTSPEVMNQLPGDRLRYVRRLTERVYGDHEKAVVRQQKLEQTKVRSSSSDKAQQQKGQGRVQQQDHAVAHSDQAADRKKQERQPEKSRRQEHDRDNGLEL